MANLGSIEQVRLREVWPHEERDFSRWLADNLDKLGEALGPELQFQEREAPVGPFFLDVLAYDRGGDRPVIIENQLESTNHGHLGQLLTYAAGYDAGVIIWLTGVFQDEHRAALDWLNQHTSADTQFFGVIVEAWRIDGSRPAPHFRVVAMPNDWQKQAAGKKRSNPTERGERYREFFQQLRETLWDEHQVHGLGNVQPRSWSGFTSGYPGIWYGAGFSTGNSVHININFDHGQTRSDWSESLFNSLLDNRAAIETELAEHLEWDQREGRRAHRIAVRRAGSIFDDHQSLEETQGWMVDRLLAFKRVFTPYLQELVE